MDEVFTVYTYDYNRILKTPCQHDKRGNRGNKSKWTGYKDCLCAFDIETTRIESIEQSVMYIWQFSILFLSDGHIDTIIGRTWDEFKLHLENLNRDDTNNSNYLIFVHNLSYEFQFLRGVFGILPEDVFVIKSRKILKCTINERFEFRCSYLQTNMSLDSFTSKMNVTHKKLSGDNFDYSKHRYSWSHMTPQELQYCYNDTIGLVEAMYKRMSLMNDTLYTLPLTSTGYVRRETKRAMYSWARLNRDIFPSIAVFNLLEEAFRGGDTHANRYYSGQVIRQEKGILGIGSYDRSSSYPDVICNCLFPMTPFVPIGNVSRETLERKHELGKATLFRITFKNIRQTDPFYGAPYLSFSKCRNVSRETLDNGRILSAETLTTTITDVDYFIIRSEYTWDDCTIRDCYESKYAPLPEQLKAVVRKYYTGKTELKGVSGQELFYAMQKALLNATYGMMVQSPVKQSIIFNDSETDIYTLDCSKDRKQLLDDYNKKAVLPFQWGVWVTAWARQRLKLGINIAADNYLYSDTDSVKYIITENSDIDARFAKLNETLKADSIENHAYATDPHGITHYMGVYEFEDTYTEFATLGAKKYVYRLDGDLHTTIAGVNKKKAPAELEAAGGIEAFKIGFTFRQAGGTESIYNDTDYGTYTVDGHNIEITKNIYIKDSTYTIGITDEYLKILTDARNFAEFKKSLDN